MGFRTRLYQFILFMSGLAVAMSANGAEWKTEPTINLRTQYNDNVRMRSEAEIRSSTDNPDSVGYTFDPRVKFKGEELQLWDISIDARGRITRFPGIENADSNNVFFVFDGGRQTERSNWRLNASYDQNSNFDTDFDTANPNVGILDDRTDRTTATIAPSVIWSMSETSQLSFSLSATDVSYDEVIGNFNFTDYKYNSAQLLANWQVLEKHSIGFTSSYAEYDSPDSNLSYNQVVLQMDYTYTINQLSDLSLSLGGRSLDTTRSNQPTGGPVLGDIKTQSNGTVVNMLYNLTSETTSQRFRVSRTISPSSFGGAQERRDITYQLSISNTERFTTTLILNAFETDTVQDGPLQVNSRFDRQEYRIEPAIRYRLNRNWNLGLRYRYLNQSYTVQDRDAESNAVFIDLTLHWPRLVSSY